METRQQSSVRGWGNRLTGAWGFELGKASLGDFEQVALGGPNIALFR